MSEKSKKPSKPTKPVEPDIDAYELDDEPEPAPVPATPAVNRSYLLDDHDVPTPDSEKSHHPGGHSDAQLHSARRMMQSDRGSAKSVEIKQVDPDVAEKKRANARAEAAAYAAEFERKQKIKKIAIGIGVLVLIVILFILKSMMGSGAAT